MIIADAAPSIPLGFANDPAGRALSGLEALANPQGLEALALV
ncbi:MAG: hypothetical protein ACREVV_07575 [Steroidobacteraceae bacterium]